MSFDALVTEMDTAVFADLGEAAVFTPDGGAPIQTRAVLDESHPVIGDLGHMVDARAVITLPKADVGQPRSGTVTLLGRTFQIDQLVDGADDGHVVRYYVRETL